MNISGLLNTAAEAAIITSPVNRRYITGFKSSYGVAVVTEGANYFLTDARYYGNALSAVTGCKVAMVDETKDSGKELKTLLGHIFEKHSITTLLIENEAVTLAELERYRKMFPKMRFDTSPRLSEALMKSRVVKSPEEIDKIKKAQRITEAAFDKIVNKLKPGLSEKQIAAMLTYYVYELGAEGPAFDFIVASGKNSSVPHAVPTNKTLDDGDFLILDFGAVVDGYHSDMTRTVAIGSASESMRRVYDAVWSANIDALKAIRADITDKLLDGVARTTLEAWGYETFFTHSLGHGVGLEVHEKPSLSIKAKPSMSLRENMVITIEPGVYIPSKYGVRLEDMAIVTKSGCELITTTPKKLLVV
ncbi:MAG: Xaa-Pro peptidase family protein [Oscillospiraceae bacterium]|nr:Xaa-Pro peptidase family protein [Oscillospiraceae bacterium]